MQADTLTDYSAQIKNDIARDVARLRHELEYPFSTSVKMRVADEVEIGYMINTHHGQPLYKDGDRVDGLIVRIRRDLPRTIRVISHFNREDEESEQLTW